ncbi:MAG: hypothetical protein ACNS62_14680 [Candidatus Cyclobacteriaceae bacterium M3_2C_046]
MKLKPSKELIELNEKMKVLREKMKNMISHIKKEKPHQEDNQTDLHEHRFS